MKKISQNASLKAFLKEAVKGVSVCVLTFTTLFSVMACDKTDGPQVKPGPTPPGPIVINKVGIDKIYNDNFAGTNFDADLHTAQVELCNKVFEDLKPQITKIEYNQDTKELKFDVSYIEEGATRSGSMAFTAPEIFQILRDEDVKSVIIEKAGLSLSGEVNETESDATKTKISNAIKNIQEQIETGFANIQTNDVAVEKEIIPPPIEKVSFDEIIQNELGEYLGNASLLHDASIQAIQQNYPTDQILNDFKIAIDNNKLIYYFNYLIGNSEIRLGSATYKGELSEFEDLINVSIAPQVLLDKYFSQEQQNKEVELNGDEYVAIVSTCNEIKNSVTQQKDQLSSKNYKNFTREIFAKHNNEITQEESIAFAEKLGYSANEVLGVYVGKSGNRGFDDQWFDTGYLNGFTLSILTNQYKIDTMTIYVPHYSNSTQADYYRYFLDGEQGKRFVVQNQTSASINGIIADYGSTTTTAESDYTMVASVSNWNLFLPEELIK